MGTNILNQIQVTLLARIPTAGGDVMHAMKAGDIGYNGFGEAYFSLVESGAVKAWKQHSQMTLNLIVPLGEVRFVFFAPASQPSFREEVIGASHYGRITVPPGIWFGFQGLAEPHSLLLNLANIAHDPGEVARREINEVPFDWSQRPT